MPGIYKAVRHIVTEHTVRPLILVKRKVKKENAWWLNPHATAVSAHRKSMSGNHA